MKEKKIEKKRHGEFGEKDEKNWENVRKIVKNVGKYSLNCLKTVERQFEKIIRNSKNNRK